MAEMVLWVSSIQAEKTEVSDYQLKKMPTIFSKSILLVGSDLNLCTIKDTFTWF